MMSTKLKMKWESNPGLPGLSRNEENGNMEEEEAIEHAQYFEIHHKTSQ